MPYTARMSAHLSSGSSCTGATCWMPALLIRMSSLNNQDPGDGVGEGVGWGGGRGGPVGASWMWGWQGRAVGLCPRTTAHRWARSGSAIGGRCRGTESGASAARGKRERERSACATPLRTKSSATCPALLAPPPLDPLHTPTLCHVEPQPQPIAVMPSAGVPGRGVAPQRAVHRVWGPIRPRLPLSLATLERQFHNPHLPNSFCTRLTMSRMAAGSRRSASQYMVPTPNS